MLERVIVSEFDGWPLHLSHSPNKRTLYNFPMQSGGAEMLRLAANRLCDADLVPSMLVHDGILFELDNEEQVAARHRDHARGRRRGLRRPRDRRRRRSEADRRRALSRQAAGGEQDVGRDGRAAGGWCNPASGGELTMIFIEKFRTKPQNAPPPPRARRQRLTEPFTLLRLSQLETLRQLDSARCWDVFTILARENFWRGGKPFSLPLMNSPPRRAVAGPICVLPDPAPVGDEWADSGATETATTAANQSFVTRRAVPLKSNRAPAPPRRRRHFEVRRPVNPAKHLGDRLKAAYRGATRSTVNRVNGSTRSTVNRVGASKIFKFSYGRRHNFNFFGSGFVFSLYMLLSS